MGETLKWHFRTRSRASNRVRRACQGCQCLAFATAVAGAVFVVLARGPEARLGGSGDLAVGMVALVNRSAAGIDVYAAQFCGGVVVSERLVLTAAHCVTTRPAGSIDVLAGAPDLCSGAEARGLRVHVTDTRIHPEYDAGSGRFDLALLLLDQPVPGRIVRDLVDVPERPEPAVAIGWGGGSGAGAPPCRLRGVALTVLPPWDCVDAAAANRPFDPASMVCAIPAGLSARDTCAGDSGGPLILGTEPGLGPVIGITSWGRGCGSGFPGVYARESSWQFVRRAEALEP